MCSLFVARHAPRLLSLALVAAGVVGGVAWHSSANNMTQMAPAPAVVGLVNLENLSKVLKEMEDRNSVLNSRNNPRVEELKALDTRLYSPKKELNDLPQTASRDKRMELVLKITELEAMFDTKSVRTSRSQASNRAACCGMCTSRSSRRARSTAIRTGMTSSC